MGSKKPTKPRAKKADNGPQKLSVHRGTDTDSEASTRGEPRAEDGIVTTSPQPAVPTTIPTDGYKEERTGTEIIGDVDGSPTSPQASPTPFPTADAMGGRKETQDTDGSTAGTTQLPPSAGNTDTGDVAVCSAVAESQAVYGPLAHEETRAQASNRWILEGRRWETDNFRKDVIRRCRDDGMTKEAASEQAWKACLAMFPPPGSEVVAIELPHPVTIEDPIEPEEPPPQPIPSDDSVPGLGTIPEDWGTLSANASLQAEISWVSANRLRVRDGNGVDLSKALSPAPSYSALSWLETSVLFPSKFADISVKATQNQEDEAQHVRREKLAIDEIRSLLAEMMEE